MDYKILCLSAETSVMEWVKVSRKTTDYRLMNLEKKECAKIRQQCEEKNMVQFLFSSRTVFFSFSNVATGPIQCHNTADADLSTLNGN